MLVQGLVQYSNKHMNEVKKAPTFPVGVESKFNTFETPVQYDENLMAPLFGYANAEEYYNDHSSLRYIGRSRIPTLHVSSIDDPMLGPEASKAIAKACAEGGELCGAVSIEHPIGGHVAFLEGLWMPKNSWVEKAIIEFFEVSLDTPN
jgi:hypothetical protein